MMWKCNIEELIIKSGFRKDYIANKIGVSVRQLRKYEKEELYIPMEKAFILIDLLGVTLNDLYERVTDNENSH